MKKEDKVIAYSGKYVTADKKQYKLDPEVVSKSCRGCAFEKVFGCHETKKDGLSLTDYCRQGFIFKRVNI